MADRSIAEKFKFKPGMMAATLHVPPSVKLGIPADALVSDPADAGFVFEFATTQDEARERLAALAPKVSGTTVVWLGYPKGSKAAGRDLNRDTVAAAARTVGLVVNANFAVDETWSAVRMRPARPGE